MRKISIDIPDDIYKELMKMKYDKDINDNVKISLGELVREAIKEWLEKQQEEK
jgi:predicted CopG family antitoxin